MYKIFWKNLLDEILSFIAIVLLSPLFIIISLIIFFDDPGPIFFNQKRVGKNKKNFILHKFRTMKTSAPHNIATHLLDNPEQYITRVGKILRKTSLDELPQLWDIFRGKMSIIGPRPALWNQYDLIDERDIYSVNSTKPGLTGLAQINGRDEISIKEKAKLDGEYVKNISFKMDFKIFFLTILSVLKHDGVVEGKK